MKGTNDYVEVGGKLRKRSTIKICQKILLVMGIFACLLGLISISVGGVIFIIFGVIFLLFSHVYKKALKQDTPKPKEITTSATDVPTETKKVESINPIPTTIEPQEKKTSVDTKQEPEQSQEAKQSIVQNTNDKVIKDEDSTIYKKIYFPDFIDGQYLISYQYDQVGIAFPNNGSLKLGDVVSLEPEPENQYDPQAIKIMKDSEKLGYMYRGKLQKMVHDFIKKDLPVIVCVDSISGKEFTCSFAFYKDISSYKSITCTLTKTTKKDDNGISRQEHLSLVNQGDSIELSYDFLTDTYLATSEYGDEIGEISKSISDKLSDEEDKYKYLGVCIENEQDDNDKYKCKIRVLKIPK